MSIRRLWATFKVDLAFTLKRPMFWTMVVFLALLTWGLSTGSVTISSGDSSVGGKRAWITSEFSSAFVLTFVAFAFIGFFAAIAAGLAVIADREAKVGEILHSTPLRPAEYVWGKALAALAAFTLALGLTAAFMMFFNHVVPNADADEIRGPFGLWNYLRPALLFGLPPLVLFVGVPFYLGSRTGRPVVAFLFPIAMMVLCGFFLWNWDPSWLAPEYNQALMLLDPAGFRWLDETWLEKDLGAEFYNTQRIALDRPFIASRIAWMLIGFAAIALASRQFGATLRGGRDEKAGRRRRAKIVEQQAAQVAAATTPVPLALPALAMKTRPLGFVASTVTVARTEAGRLLREPGVWLFGFFVVLESLGTSLTALGAFNTEILLTPGLLAIRSFNTLSLLVCLLLMFFTAEGLQREKAIGLDRLVYSSPLGSGAFLTGKALGNSLVGLVMVLAVFAGCVIGLLAQGRVPFSVAPFVLVWGLLLTPTFLAWTAFVTAVQAVTGNRFATYGVGMGAIGATLYCQFTNKMNWVGNWWLWDTVRWSDMSLLEIDRRALVLNRLFVLALAVFFFGVAVRYFQRRDFDATRILQRLRPLALGGMLLRLSPLAVAPLGLGLALFLGVADGYQGKAAEKDGKDYWKQNLATWREAENPGVVAVDVELAVDPNASHLASRGHATLENQTAKPMRRFALTGGRHWRDVEWTLGGARFEPEDRSRLYVFELAEPLAPGAKVVVGWSFQGHFPDGMSKNGGGAGNFILPSGVVMTSFGPDFVPMLGYQEGVGVDKENRYEPKEYPPDFYLDRLKPAFGTSSAFTTRVRITAPAEFTMNSVGVLESETVLGGRRTVTWVSDHPVRFFNVVGGRYKVRKGETTKIFYHPEHEYNVEEMSRVLEGARRFYSEWFHPYPWQELKLSEFPALASYAQGFPTNIPFSEGIGFLTKSDVKTDAVALVTAHEAAHQWWANILTPGEGPGNNLLSEGMSHFASMLLLEELNGPRARMEFSKRIEERYGEGRRKDAERPLVLVDGSREGDTTVTYDKGGWVFWMTLEHLGREAALAGIREFIATYKDGPDYPVLQDYTNTLRAHAADPEAYDRFVAQWYHEVVLPEFRLSEAKVEAAEGGHEVTLTIAQVGTGAVEVEVAASAGERFPKEGEEAVAYRESRTTVALAAGETKTITIATDFEPERIVVDPDVRVLQLGRNRALLEL